MKERGEERRGKERGREREKESKKQRGDEEEKETEGVNVSDKLEDAPFLQVQSNCQGNVASSLEKEVGQSS